MEIVEKELPDPTPKAKCGKENWQKDSSTSECSVCHKEVTACPIFCFPNWPFFWYCGHKKVIAAYFEHLFCTPLCILTIHLACAVRFWLRHTFVNRNVLFWHSG